MAAVSLSLWARPCAAQVPPVGQAVSVPWDEDDDERSFGIDGREPLPNFHRVSPAVLRSGQPNAEGLRTAKEAGVRTVLSLRLRVGDAERGAVAGLGMRMENVRMNGVLSPAFSQIDEALLILTDPARTPALVHCRYGKDRTGVVVAAYRMIAEGWTPEEASSEAHENGCCAPFFKDLPGFLEAYRRHRRAILSASSPRPRPT